MASGANPVSDWQARNGGKANGGLRDRRCDCGRCHRPITSLDDCRRASTDAALRGSSAGSMDGNDVRRSRGRSARRAGRHASRTSRCGSWCRWFGYQTESPINLQSRRCSFRDIGGVVSIAQRHHLKARGYIPIRLFVERPQWGDEAVSIDVRKSARLPTTRPGNSDTAIATIRFR